MNTKSTKLAVRHGLRKLTYPIRLTTSSVRSLPEFIIIGGMKCASTSLWYYLDQHPSIFTAIKKEVHFFDSDINFNKGINWYRSHFPISRNFISGLYLSKMLVGEATPSYMFCPHVPKRMAKFLPDIKLIALLRNPVDRAYSHYRHLVRAGREDLSFEKAIKKETKIEIRSEIIENKLSTNYQNNTYSYLRRGIYVDQLKLWFTFFDKDQLLVLKTEDLANNPSKTYKKVLDFLELSYWEPQQYRRLNSDPDNSRENPSCVGLPKINKETRKKLVDYFEPHNQSLYQYLGIDFGWS